MTSRERILNAVNHITPDRVPIDFGGTSVTGMHIQVVENLRKHFGLSLQPVKVIEPIQMLGEIDDELKNILGIDTISIPPQKNKFGTNNDEWREFRTLWGQVVLFPASLKTSEDRDGNIYLHPQGDLSTPPSAVMAKKAYFFDALIRQQPIDEAKLNPDDNLEEYGLISDEDLKFWKNTTTELEYSDKAFCVGFGGMALGDIALIPGVGLKQPKGIRDITEWYVSILLRQEYIHAVFEKQTDIALENLKRLYPVVKDRVDVAYICGTDFGTQSSLFCSPETFSDLYLPYYKKINTWIHENTSWKTFKHSCGAVEPLMQYFIEAGFDIINPVQISATGMDSRLLKEKYGDKLTFWGGGVDTQHVLAFGSPTDVKKQVREQCDVLGKNGGFVFNSVHNIQANTPVENVLAMFDAVKEAG